MSPDFIREALRQVRYPGFSRDIVSFGLVKDIQTTDTGVTVKIEIQTRDPDIPEKIFKDCHAVLDDLPDVGQVKVEIEIKDTPGQTSASGKSSIPGVKKIIAVASGKGGVGKSTVAANLAIALSKTGARVGLCDCDLYGPSVALMFGTNERPNANEQDEIIPIEAHGLQLMSMGFLLEDRSPVIVRGPMATRYTQQFLRQVAWDHLDYLILDLPPGTGDIQLTIVQTASVDGAIIVTTPQEVALIDARKAVSMFAKVNVRSSAWLKIWPGSIATTASVTIFSAKAAGCARRRRSMFPCSVKFRSIRKPAGVATKASRWRCFRRANIPWPTRSMSSRGLCASG